MQCVSSLISIPPYAVRYFDLTLRLQDLTRSPNKLASCYNDSAVARRIQLTGHSHQALPDIANSAYQEHWECLTKYGEERWEEVFAKAELLRQGFASMLDDEPENIALASSVHDLFVRFLSVLPLDKRPRIVTSDAEPPSIGRQLARLAEAGIEVVQVPAQPASDLVERLSAQIDGRTAAVCVSSVNYESGQQALELDTLLPICQHHGAELFVDAYQSINVLPFSLQDYNLQQAFVAGGGAKYCQMGSGISFMHVPPGRDFRPVISGWFGCFDPIYDNPAATPIAYADDASRFNGSTVDDLSYFRGVKVLAHFRHWQLTPDFLFEVNRYQLNLLAREFQALDLPSDKISLPVGVDYMGGFVGLHTPYARLLSEKMRDRGVHTDFRGHWLRLGPAPYLCDEQLQDAMMALHESFDELG